MARYMCMDTLRFLLFDVHRSEEVFSYPRYNQYNLDMAGLLLDSMKEWADRDFYPYFKEMDEKPVYFKDGIVYTHPVLKKIFQEAGEKGFLGSYFDEEDGGMQLPYSIANAANHILEAANNHIPGYLGLTSGAAHLIASFGNEHLKKTYIPNMLKGVWGGTMALTEPQAGSSLADITTKAIPQPDGTYHIQGQKIFISGGDHQAAENIIHLTLARIEGAPAGTKGISLFVVPKYIPEGDSLVYNHVETAGDFQKLGQRGYSTVHLVYGENQPCTGYLVGMPEQGLNYMFQMMNGARIDVGMTAASTATAAYYHSLQYAKERPQGRKILQSGKKDTSESQTLIINHPDVRRMLFFQKAVTEGALSLLIYCSKLQDIVTCASGEEQRNAKLLLELLTPMAKTYPSEKGRDAVHNGLQILGGYGYCMDFILQQYARDIRIMSIYEGTTGIQSLDLLGRKITLENGAAIQLLAKQIRQTIDECKKETALETYSKALEEGLADVEKALSYLLPYAMKGDYENYLADATIFMDLLSNVVIAHQWLEIGKVVISDVDKSDFFNAKWQTMKFYYKYELPKTKAALQTIIHGDKLTTDVAFDNITL